MKNISILAMAMLMGTASPGFAASAHIQGNVLKTLIADQDRWGGCMILIDQKLSDHGLDCPQQWVSFSCNGTYTTKDVAYRMFDSAQMAYALGKRVFLQVVDTKKHNGYCYASRVDVLD
jgi:hypothetical protein